MLIFEELKALSLENRSIKVGLVGAGFMGRGIVEVIESTPAMEVVAVSDIDINRAKECFEGIHFINYREIRNSDEGKRINFPEERVVTTNYRLILGLAELDFIIEATGIPEIGAEVAYYSIMNKKNIGMLNIETDVTIGHYLSTFAREKGVVYTVCTGDEPAAIKEIHDFAKALGFTVVTCGKGKNNPLDVTATPDSMKSRAKAMGLNPRILTEFVDGTKTMVEMSCVANACGLTIDRRNMHGPQANVSDLTKIFCLEHEGGILKREGVIEYTIGDVAPGVFAVVRHRGKIVNETLRYLKVGDGPRFLLYRPYHLASVETPVSIALGYLYNKPVLSTSSLPGTEVITYAKKNLERGEYIDHIGGFTVYGGIEIYEKAQKEALLPLGLSEGARLKRDVEKGKPITYSHVELRDSLLLDLRKVQDRLHD